MDENEDLYKREEDRKWREKVDHEQVTLMTAVNVLQEQLRDLRSTVKDHDVDLRGEKGRGGLIAEFEKHDDKLTKLYAVIFQDPTGQKGLLHDVDFLMGRKRYTEAEADRRWTFAQGVIVAVVGAIATVIVAALAIEPVRKGAEHWISSQFSAPSSRSIAKTASKRSGTKRRKHPPTEDSNDSTGEDLP